MTKTFKQFLSEQDDQDLMKFLKENCAQACKDMFEADRYFWRGAEKESDQTFAVMNRVFPGIIVTPREDRTPRDSIRKIHDAANSWFKRKLGQPIRSNTVFTHPCRATAGRFGPAKAVIPFGKYQVYWSPRVSDFTNYVQPAAPDDGVVGGNGHKFYNDYSTQQRQDGEIGWIDQEELLEKFLEAADYQEGDVIKALKSKHEIMVRCSKYLLLDISKANLTKIIMAVNE